MGKAYPTKDLSDPSHTLYFQLSALKIVTMWKPLNAKFNILSQMAHALNIVVLAVATIGLLVKAVTTKDLVDRSEAMDIFTLTGSALYKMVYFYFYHDKFVDMVNCGLALTPILPVGWTKNSTLYSKIHCALGCFTISFWGVCPILKCIFRETELAEMKLPINTYDPAESEGLLFVFFYCCCYYALLVSAHIYMAADAYLFTSIYVAIGALQSVHDKLRSMASYDYGFKANATKITQRHDYESIDEVHDHLKDCVELHAHILDYIRKTDKLFRSMILADVLHAIISLSFAMLQASESKGILENLKMIVFVGYCFVHQFLNSHFGQELIDKQDNMSEQVFTAVPWAERSQAFKKSYQIMVTNNKSSVKLSAWNVYVLQYGTFLEFVKSMISYYMVLRELQDEAEEI